MRVELVCRGRILGYACAGNIKASNAAAGMTKKRVSIVAKVYDYRPAQPAKQKKNDGETEEKTTRGRERNE